MPTEGKEHTGRPSVPPNRNTQYKRDQVNNYKTKIQNFDMDKCDFKWQSHLVQANRLKHPRLNTRRPKKEWPHTIARMVLAELDTIILCKNPKLLRTEPSRTISPTSLGTANDLQSVCQNCLELDQVMLWRIDNAKLHPHSPRYKIMNYPHGRI